MKSSLRLFETGPKTLERAGEPGELFEVQSREALDLVPAACGQEEPDDAVIVPVTFPADETERLGTVCQTHGAVVSQEQLVGDVPNGWSAGVGMSSHDEEQLMLSRRESDVPGLLLAPVKEAAKTGAKLEQCSVLVAVDFAPREWIRTNHDSTRARSGS